MAETSSNSSMKMETLEIEDEDARQSRIQTTLEKLAASTAAAKEPNQFPKFDFGDRSTFEVKPPTELLSRARMFLPKIEAANALLALQDPSNIDIEILGEDADQYIEMNLGLGVYEDRSHKSDEPNMGTEMSSGESSSDSGDLQHKTHYTEAGHSGSDESSDEESDDDEIITGFVEHRRIRPLPRRAQKSMPKIVVLGNAE